MGSILNTLGHRHSGWRPVRFTQEAVRMTEAQDPPPEILICLWWVQAGVYSKRSPADSNKQQGLTGQCSMSFQRPWSKVFSTLRRRNCSFTPSVPGLKEDDVLASDELFIFCPNIFESSLLATQRGAPAKLPQ